MATASPFVPRQRSRIRLLEQLQPKKRVCGSLKAPLARASKADLRNPALYGSEASK